MVLFSMSNHKCTLEERIHQVELEIVEIKTRMDKKHEEIANVHSDMDKLTECINSVVALTEKINATQEEMYIEFREMRTTLYNTREEVITHKTTFDSYRERQKSAMDFLTVGVAIIAIIVPIIMNFILR